MDRENGQNGTGDCERSERRAEEIEMALRRVLVDDAELLNRLADA